MESCPTLCNPMDCSIARLPHPPPSPGVCSNSCSLSLWCHPNIREREGIVCNLKSGLQCLTSLLHIMKFAAFQHLSWIWFKLILLLKPTCNFAVRPSQQFGLTWAGQVGAMGTHLVGKRADAYSFHRDGHYQFSSSSIEKNSWFSAEWTVSQPPLQLGVVLWLSSGP